MIDTNQQQTAAESATGAAIDAHISGNAEKAAPLFNRASVEHRRQAAATEQPGGDDWRNGTEVAPLSPMPEAPRLHTDDVSYAAEKLQAMGGEHAELARNWGPDLGENLAYAQAALLDVAANRPDLIAKVDASGLGDDPAVLEFLSRQGRLTAGLMNDHTISRRNDPVVTTNRSAPSTRRASGPQAELDQLMADHPPGSDSYKTPSIQRKAEALSRQIAGSGNAVGQGGRYA